MPTYIPVAGEGWDMTTTSGAALDADALDGVSCPLVTPFADGGVDADALAGLVERVVDAGVTALVPAGTTGEFASLTDEEYRVLLRTTTEAAPADVPVVAGTAATSVPGALDRVETAAAAGADAALVTLPYFHTANDPAGNERFLRAVAEASALPLYLYNIPSCTGAVLSPETAAAVAEHDAVHGVKDSGGDFNYFSELLRLVPDGIRCLQGFDSLLVPGTLAGGHGGICALTNVVPEAHVAAVDAVRAGEFERARRIHREAIAPLFQRCVEHGFAPGTKAALAARGWLPEGSTGVRAPLVDLDDGAAAEVAGLVDEVVATDARD
jgi:4-hydroxy-tetrahydrodipicolinate synthase